MLPLEELEAGIPGSYSWIVFPSCVFRRPREAFINRHLVLHLAEGLERNWDKNIC